MSGSKITISNGKLNVPYDPIIPFIEGDGIGPDIWAASVRVLDAAVEKAYAGERKINWHEVYAGQKAFDKTGEWLPGRQEPPRLPYTLPPIAPGRHTSDRPVSNPGTRTRDAALRDRFRPEPKIREIHRS